MVRQRTGRRSALALLLCVLLLLGSFSPAAMAAGTQEAPLTWEDTDNLGNWTHYNGYIFEDMTAHQADSEGALAVGGDADFALTGGYDIGAAYNYYNTVHIGNYENPGNVLPSFVLGGMLSMHSHNGTVYGGPVVMTREALTDMTGATNQLYLSSGGDGWIVMDQSDLDGWFSDQRSRVETMSSQFVEAAPEEITLEELSDRSYLDAGAAAYENRTMTYNGSVDDSVLIINVRSDETVKFGNGGYNLPVSKDWCESYDLVIFNFVDAVNVSMDADPETIVGGLAYNKTWGDGDISSAAAAERKNVASTVVFNFPEAAHISSDGVFILGSVIAPQAKFYAEGGSLNGNLVAREFETEGSMELHAFSINPKIYDLEGASPTGDIALTKYMTYSGITTTYPLEGAEYVLVREEDGLYFDGEDFVPDIELAEVYTTGEGGELAVTGVPWGEYLLREVTAPEGYRINDGDPLDGDTYFEYPVTVGDTGVTVYVTRYNEPETADIHLRKVDAQDGDQGLEGAVFDLVREADESYPYDRVIHQDLTSGQDGYLVLENLPRGSYRLVETAPPDGYLYPEEDFSFQVDYDEGGTLRVTGALSGLDQASALPVENETGTPENLVTIFKYDDTHGDTGVRQGLGGVTFDLFYYDDDNDQWIRVEETSSLSTPGAMPVITWPEESEAPAEESRGPEADGDPTEDGEEAEGGESQSAPETAETQEPEGDAPVNSTGGAAPVEPARAEPDELAIDTDSAGYYQISQLPAGKYRLVESGVPEGYYSANLSFDEAFPDGYAHELEIDSDVLTYTVNIPNYAKLAEVTVEKRLDDGETTVEGAGFSLHRRTELGDWETVTPDAYTLADGRLTFTDLTEGVYRLTETVPPQGASGLEAPVYFTLTIDEERVPSLTAIYLDEEVGSDTSPVALREEAGTLVISVENALDTVSLLLYKYDRTVYQLGTDQENYSLRKTYLEGAVFHLQRESDTVSGLWQDYGDFFTSELLYREDGEPLTDQYGNHMAAAALDGLIYGNYRIVETAFPAGYISGTQYKVTLDRLDEASQPITGDRVGQFTVTHNYAQENQVFTWETVNSADVPSSDLTVRKVDQNGDGIAGVPFKLWTVVGGAEDWTADITISEVMAEFDQLEFYKYAAGDGTSSFYTDSDGTLLLEDLPPGVYVLFEHWEDDEEFIREYLYLLSHETTEANEMDISFYYHLTTFKVVAVDENDSSKGTRILWVHQEKLNTGEAEFDNSVNNVPAEDWDDSLPESVYRSLTVTNKLVSDLDVSVGFLKTDDEGEPLDGAEFSLYKKVDFTLPDGDMDAYEFVTSATSGDGEPGEVRFDDVSVSWREPDGTEVSYRTAEEILLCGEYMILETAAPTGYVLCEEPIFFRLQLNALTKMVDLYITDSETGTAYPHSIDGNIIYVNQTADPWHLPGYLAPESDGAEAAFIRAFTLSDMANQPEQEAATGFTFRKVDAADMQTVLEGAEFTLYPRDGDEAVAVATSGEDGLVTFTDLPPGAYRLVETAAPTGYALPTGWWEIDVDGDGDVTVTASSRGSVPDTEMTGEGDAAAFLVGNRESAALPLTGGGGIRPLLLAGGGLLLAGLGALALRWRRLRNI